MCEWGNSKPWRWARDVGHSWRTTPDIWCDFDSLRVFPGYTQFGVMQCIELNDTLRQYAAFEEITAGVDLGIFKIVHVGASEATRLSFLDSSGYGQS